MPQGVRGAGLQTGSEPDEPEWAAGTLNRFSIFAVPQSGHFARSSPRSKSSKSDLHVGQVYS
jgi:hypothetical protein